MLGEGSGDEAQLGTLSQSLAQDFWRVLSTLKAQTFKSKGVWRLSMNVNVEKRPTFFRFTYFSGRNPGKWVCCQQKITWVLRCHTVRSTVQALAGWQVEVERRNFQTLSETWSSNGFGKEWNQLVHFWIWCDAVVLTACARAFPQQEYTFQECHVDFSLACAIQFYRSHRSHLDMMHCRIALAKVHKACVWKAQSIHCEETGANKSCCEQTSSKPVAKMMWGGETPSRSIVFVSDHFAKSLSKATSWWSQHKFCKW